VPERQTAIMSASREAFVIAAHSKFRAGLTLAMALLVFGLSVFAVIGGLHKTPIFAAIPLKVSPGAMILVGLTATLFASVGALIAFRARGNAVGWLLWACGLPMALTLAGITWVARGLPGGVWAEWLAEWVSVISFVLVAYILLLFPDGKLRSRRWRPALWLCHVTLVAVLLGMFTPYVRGSEYAFDSPLGYSGYRKGVYGVLLNNGNLGWFLLVLAIVAGAASFVVRYRASTGIQRQQLKWFALAAGVNAFGFSTLCVTYLLSVVGSITSIAVPVVFMVLCVNAIPVASGFAILRYRLYDIDRIISRAVAYLVVSGVLVGVYLGVVAAATAVLPSHSSVAVAAATLAAAAVLEPTRRRAQTLVDRRFNRARYNAITTISAFASRQKDRFDPATVCDDLSRTISATLEPSLVTVWIRSSA
jgi:hypothetical protein